MTQPTDMGATATTTAPPVTGGNVGATTRARPDASADVVLRLTDIHTYYGHIHALQGVSLEVRRGEIVTLLGANGAGKTTTLKTISGLLHARTGKIEFEGEDITRVAPHALVKRGVCQSPEGRRIFGRMTVIENLQMGAYSRARGQQLEDEYENVFTLFPRLRERRTQTAGTLSGGEQQMLAIGRALMSKP